MWCTKKKKKKKIQKAYNVSLFIPETKVYLCKNFKDAKNVYYLFTIRYLYVCDFDLVWILHNQVFLYTLILIMTDYWFAKFISNQVCKYICIIIMIEIKITWME